MRRTTQRREAKAFPSTAHHRNFLLRSQSGRRTVISVTENTNMSNPCDLVQGTLDMLLLKILALEPMNGFAVSQRLKQVSGDVLQVSDGSWYPALHKLEQESWIRLQPSNVGAWATGEILLADAAGAATARKRSGQLGQAFERDFARGQTKRGLRVRHRRKLPCDR